MITAIVWCRKWHKAMVNPAQHYLKEQINYKRATQKCIKMNIFQENVFVVAAHTGNQQQQLPGFQIKHLTVKLKKTPSNEQQQCFMWRGRIRYGYPAVQRQLSFWLEIFHLKRPKTLYQLGCVALIPLLETLDFTHTASCCLAFYCCCCFESKTSPLSWVSRPLIYRCKVSAHS